MNVPLYTEDNYYDDLMRVTEDLADADLALTLVRESQPTMRWMKAQGIRWIPMFGRQAFKVGGKFTFFGNLVLEAVGGGPGLIDMHYESAKKKGIDVRFEAKAHRLLTDARGAVTGVEIRTPDGGSESLAAKAVVLAAGGFEANVEMRTRYLGPNWDLARVRGTPYNTGDGIRMALDIGAQAWGHRSGWHAVQWDYNAPWHAALRRLRGDHGHHVHVRRPAHHDRGPRAERRSPADRRTLRRRRAGGRALLQQLPRRRRPHGGRRVRPHRRPLRRARFEVLTG